MKRTAILLFLVAAWTFAIAAQTQFCIDGILYQVSSANPSEVNVIHPINAASYMTGKTMYQEMDIKRLEIPGEVTNPADGTLCTVVSVHLGNSDTVEEIILPNTVRSIEYLVDFPELKTIVMPDNLVFMGEISQLPKLETLTIPTSVSAIEVQRTATLFDIGVSSLSIPHYVTRLESFTIIECPELRELTLSGAETLRAYSVMDLPELNKLTFSPTLANVHDNSVIGTDPVEIWFLSDGVEQPWKLSVNSFVCHTKRVYCARMTPPTFDGDMTAPEYASVPADRLMFYGPGNIGNVTLYVPAEAVEAYKAAPNWGLMNIQPYNFRDNIPLTAADATPAADTPLYDLQGCPAPTDTPTPGIYLRAGKKVIVR